MKAIRSILRALVAGCLAIVLTLLCAELGALAGWGRNAMVNTAMCCVWLMVVFHVMAWQSRRFL